MSKPGTTHDTVSEAVAALQQRKDCRLWRMRQDGRVWYIVAKSRNQARHALAVAHGFNPVPIDPGNALAKEVRKLPDSEQARLRGMLRGLISWQDN